MAHGHAGEGAITHTIATFRRFSSRLLHPRKAGFAIFTVGPNDEGRIISIWWRNGRLRAPIFDLDTEQRIGSARVTRPNRRAVRVTIRVDQLGDLGDPARYRWAAVSFFTNKGFCKGPEGCLDFAPNRGLIRHLLPEPPPDDPPNDWVGSNARGLGDLWLRRITDLGSHVGLQRGASSME